MGFPPEAFLIGAQKAGTTTLAELLDQHPRITVSDPKEPDFFTRNWDRGLGWYRTVFRGPEDTVYLDASPSYSAGPLAADPEHVARQHANPRAAAPERIRTINPNARFIYLLRDPVARTYSSYWHRVRAGEERRSFREAITNDPFYLQTSDYHGQLLRYLRYFPLGAFLLLLFEELRDDPVGVARRCFEFLSVQPEGYSVVLDAPRNPTYLYSNAGLVLTRLFPSWQTGKATTRLAKRILPRRVQSLARRVLTKETPPMADDDRAYLVAYFREPNQRLRELTGISLDRWHQ
jgi:hypothetical protein